MGTNKKAAGPMYKFKMQEKMGFTHVLEHYFTWKIIKNNSPMDFKNRTVNKSNNQKDFNIKSEGQFHVQGHQI